jgi:poly-gamma-glutamate synthesis protein (capsule biosynthesis protein)
LGDIALTAQFNDPSNHPALEEAADAMSGALHPADLRIANWEAPLMGREGLNPLKKLALHTNLETARRIESLRLGAAILANNHVFDALESGFEQTVSFLEAAGVRFLGAGITLREAQSPLLMDVRGVPLALLAYVDPDTHPRVPVDSHMRLNWLEPDRVLDETRSWASAGKAVLVHFHAGMDFVSLPSPGLRKLARRTIESGAAAVVCYHPHRVQGYERWSDGYVFYSLGNFIAGDIYPMPGFALRAAAVTCQIQVGGISDVRIQHIILGKGLPQLDQTGRGPGIYRRLSKVLAMPDKDYARRWRGALYWDLAVTRPVHFLRRHPNPLRLASSLEWRHLSEYRGILRRLNTGKEVERQN